MAYKLTPLGDSKVLRIGEPRSPEDAILVFMYEQKDALNVEEIAGETRLPEEQTQRILNRLSSGDSKYVKEV